LIAEHWSDPVAKETMLQVAKALWPPRMSGDGREPLCAKPDRRYHGAGEVACPPLLRGDPSSKK
jgi:hypothetical protein